MRLRAFLFPLFVISTILGLLHWFIYSMVVFNMTQPPAWIGSWFMVGWLLIPLSLILSMSRHQKKLLPLIMTGYVWFGTFGIAFFFACVQAVLALFTSQAPEGWMLVAVPLVALWALRINITGPQVVRHWLKGPAFMHGLRVVQISDLHIGNTILKEKWLAKVVDQILALEPDILVVTGDLADGPYARVAPMLSPLERIKCQKLYVTGNHEYIRGGDWPSCLQKLGFKVLHNDHVLVERAGGTLLIGGVPDRGIGRFIRNGESRPDQALHSSANVGYKILLAHEPSSVFDIEEEKCDLLLAGHTHGGQIFPFGLFVRLQQPVAAGFKSIRNTLVFAHQGTGFWGPPMRWFTRSEIVEFSWE